MIENERAFLYAAEENIGIRIESETDMEFQNCTRNEFGKCETPANTIKKIEAGLKKLSLEVGYAPFQVSEAIYWGRIWIDSLKIACLGKGVTPELAEASAYAELAERLSAGLYYPVFEEKVRFNVPALYDDRTHRFLNYEWMDGYVQSHQDALENPLKIEDLLARETHLEKKHLAEFKNSRLAQHWVDGYSLLRQEKVKIPVNFVTYIHGSNGIAAGNTIEEALVQASCEIFERYSTIHIVKGEKIAPTIDGKSIGFPLIEKMVRFYESQNVDIIFKDLSLDGLLPSIGVLFINNNLRSDRLEHRILIAGASFNTEEGLTRCFTEGMQGRDTLRKTRPELDKPILHKSQEENLYLLMKCGISTKDISFLEQGEPEDYKGEKLKDILSELDRIKQICAQFKTDCFLLNFTHPTLDFPVVRVVIPKVSDFLPFFGKKILISEATNPDAAWGGEEFRKMMGSFFKR